MYPKNVTQFTNKTECFVYNFLEKNLSNKFTCYYNYFVDEKEMDFLILVPGLGVVILEVKGWNGQNIIRISDNEKIYYLDHNNKEQQDFSPLKQCRKYCLSLHKKIQKQLDLNVIVAPVVCYPNMTEETYYEKSMNMISERNVTLLKDDFEKNETFTEILIRKCSHISRKHFDAMNDKNYIKIRSLYETKAEINQLKCKTEKKIILKKENYSKIYFLSRNMDSMRVDHLLEEVLIEWKKGIKIIILTEIENINRLIFKKMKDCPDYHYLTTYKQFRVFNEEKRKYTNQMFHLEIHEAHYDVEMAPFQIVDSVCEKQEYIDVLEYFDCNTNFNYKQYRVEHADHQKNILVSAGAGTGKTYSMISRISYLIYKNAFSPNELVDSIFLITFTNEAANNMKNRLNEYFRNLFILTENIEFLAVMEAISNMQISTIHSLVKKIIQFYSVKLGVGTTITIQSGVYERREAIVKEINELIKIDDNYSNYVARFDKYELVKAIENLLNQFEKKNIDLTKTYNFGTFTREPLLFEFVKNVAENVQTKTINDDLSNNKVQLANLMIYLERILDELEVDDTLSHPIKYLFVDEFQDTDDLQINMIKRFQKIFKFNLFVVGDIKQCIYRFRGAEDDAFDRLLEGEMTGWDDSYHLTKNYRTYKELLDNFDTYFKVLGENGLLSYDEDSVLEGVKKSNSSDSLMLKCNFGDEQDFEQLLINEINEKLLNLKEKETIAILTRTNEEIEQVRQICKRNNIDIKTDMADNLYELESTIDLYKLILALQFNNNPKYLYNLSLSNYSRNISNRVVYSHRENPNYITQLFMNNKIIPDWSTYIESLKNEPVIRVINKMIDQIKPWNQYVNSLGIKDEEEKLQKKKHYKRNVDLLIETIIQRSNDEYMTINKIRDFLYIMIFAKQHEDERTSETKGRFKAVCTTVHKSKGLEYSHVILPFCDSELETGNRNELIVKGHDIGLQMRVGNVLISNSIFQNEKDAEKQSKLQEEARILYVAMTRAEKTFTWFKSNSEKHGVKVTYGQWLERGMQNENHNL